MLCNGIVNVMVSHLSHDQHLTLKRSLRLLNVGLDFYHVISGGFPVSVSGEIIVKWFELANMGLPVAALSAVFGPLRLSSGRRGRLLRSYVPWALKCGSTAQSLISVQWESHWETDLDELRNELGIWDPPVDWNTWKAEESRIKRDSNGPRVFN